MPSNNIDTQLNNIFDEDNTPPEFDVVLRGYDRTQVTDYLDGLRNEVKQNSKQIEKFKAELTSKNRQLQERERPSYSGLGSRIEELLRLAEEQANE
ncbi:cellulose-binding protein, partial [Nocardiopsis tropica]|nr:cellulose-binding protein [Nocardiopsis tropica]